LDLAFRILECRPRCLIAANADWPACIPLAFEITSDMGKKFDLRVSINANGKSRALFSVKDPPNGEMLVSRKSPDTLRPSGLNPWKMPIIQGVLPAIKEQRYSIHPSLESEDGNLLKSTMKIASGKTFHTHHWTKTIKSGQNYAPMFVQRCPTLDSENYSVTKPGIQELSLGSYDPQHFTPFFGVFVAARDNVFELPVATQFPAVFVPINVAQHQFHSVRLIVLWSFLSLPSHSSSMASLFQTTADAPERSGGLTALQCRDYFAQECCKMEDELRMFMYFDVQGDPREAVMVPLERYFEDGTVLTPKAAEYMAALKIKTKTLRL
jgi:hypothetical protein